jgi:hypothetical protein
MSDFQGFLLGRVTCLFGEDDSERLLRAELSASAFDPEGNLWLASDEVAGVSRLSPVARGVFGDHRDFDLVQTFALPDGDEEIDIEGMDFSGGFLWLAGSHTSTRKKVKPDKSDSKNLKRLARVRRNLNRFVIGRVAVEAGIVAADPAPASLPIGAGGNALIEALQSDPHLGPFVHIPVDETQSLQLASKENGFDIEGLAVHDGRLFLGLRGPVLRGWALLLEIEVEETGPGSLGLRPIGDAGRPYRKHFLNLAGMGIRDLIWQGDDLLVLAGPTMDISGLETVYRFQGAAGLEDDSITDVGEGGLEGLFDLPVTRDGDKAEGLELFNGFGEPGLLVVYDAPLASRFVPGGGILADVFRLSGS